MSAPNLATASEIAVDLGVHRRTIYRWVEHPDFPEPVLQTTLGSLWDVGEVKDWERRTAPRRKVGRPRGS